MSQPRSTDGATLVAGGRRPAGLDTGFYLRADDPDRRRRRTRGSPRRRCSVPCCRCCATATTTTRSRSPTTRQYGLSGAVWGGDVDRAVAVARRVRTGQIAVNGCIPGDAPFGGFKQSGLGARAAGFRACTATWSRRPSECLRDGGAGGVARRRDRRRHRRAVLHEAARRPRRRRHQDRTAGGRSAAPVGAVPGRCRGSEQVRDVRVPQRRKARRDSRSRR